MIVDVVVDTRNHLLGDNAFYLHITVARPESLEPLVLSSRCLFCGVI